MKLQIPYVISIFKDVGQQPTETSDSLQKSSLKIDSLNFQTKNTKFLQTFHLFDLDTNDGKSSTQRTLPSQKSKERNCTSENPSPIVKMIDREFRLKRELFEENSQKSYPNKKLEKDQIAQLRLSVKKMEFSDFSNQIYKNVKLPETNSIMETQKVSPKSGQSPFGRHRFLTLSDPNEEKSQLKLNLDKKKAKIIHNSKIPKVLSEYFALKSDSTNEINFPKQITQFQQDCQFSIKPQLHGEQLNILKHIDRSRENFVIENCPQLRKRILSEQLNQSKNLQLGMKKDSKNSFSQIASPNLQKSNYFEEVSQQNSQKSEIPIHEFKTPKTQVKRENYTEIEFQPIEKLQNSKHIDENDVQSQYRLYRIKSERQINEKRNQSKEHSPHTNYNMISSFFRQKTITNEQKNRALRNIQKGVEIYQMKQEYFLKKLDRNSLESNQQQNKNVHEHQENQMPAKQNQQHIDSN